MRLSFLVLILPAFLSVDLLSYTYKVTNKLDVDVSGKINYKDFLGLCANPTTFDLKPNETKSIDGVGACCVTWIEATAKGGKEIRRSAADSSVRCFNFDISIARKADGTAEIQR